MNAKWHAANPAPKRDLDARLTWHVSHARMCGCRPMPKALAKLAESAAVFTAADGRVRCGWCAADPLYVRYHDEEWGTPERRERQLFEFVVLEGAQAGLSWLTILKKREGYRRAFDRFDPERVAKFTPREVEKLLGDASIVRNRAKIESAIVNAKATLALRNEGGLERFIWSHAPAKHARPRSYADIPTRSVESDALSKAMLARGFKFVGTTTLYALMQAAGVVDDHVARCFKGARVDVA